MPSLASYQQPDPDDPLQPLQPLTETPDPNAQTPGAYTPERVDINPETDTVQGQLKTITSSGGPLMEQARTRALQFMNDRGTLNSSMAAQAGEEAVYNTALPIAQADASIYGRRKELNQAAGNTALGIGAQGRQDIANIQAGGVETRTTQQEAADIQSRLNSENEDIQKRLLTADADEKLRLTNRQGEIETELQEARLTQNSEIEAARNTLAERLQAADLGSRAAIVAQQLENERTLQTNSLATQRWLANKSDTLARDMPALEGAERERQINLMFENDKAMLDAKLSYETSLRSAMDVYDKGIITAQGAEQLNQIAARAAVETQLLNSQLDTQKFLADKQRTLEAELQSGRITSTETMARQQRELDFDLNEARLAAQQTLADNSNALQERLQATQGTQALDLANVEAQYKTLMQSSDSAVRHFMQISGDITRIMTDPEIELTSKQQLIDQEIKLLQDGLEIIGAAAGVDFNELLDYGTGG